MLIVGLGNTLRGDDALGRIAAERTRLHVDPQHVKVIDQVALTPELAAEVADASLAIFLDASVDGPEEHVLTRKLDAQETIAPSAHQLSAPAVMHLARHLYHRAPAAYAITFRARSLNFSDNCLSPAAEQACQAVVNETLAIIHRYSEESKRRPHA